MYNWPFAISNVLKGQQNNKNTKQKHLLLLLSGIYENKYK